MKILGFVKKVFFMGLTILSNFTNASSLNTFFTKCNSIELHSNEKSRV